jgi:elongation of very long chain fatty acids protein 4
VTAGLPFVDSPTGVLLSLAMYLSIVLAGSAVLAARPPQAAAAKRPDPAWLRSLVLLHNLFLVVLSVYMCSG